jgi:hypothetical protein
LGLLPCVNTRLVAAVQTRSGARCHESAHLLHTYYMCADVYRKRLGRGAGADALDAARRRLQQVEVRMREFLTYSCGRAGWQN